MKKLMGLRKFAIASALMCAAATSQADVISVGTLAGAGAGLGTVNTLLTLRNVDGSSTGAVTRAGGMDVVSGNAQTGASQSSTFSFSELNITNADQIQLIFNASEPGNTAANSINVAALTFSIYSNTGGAALFSTSLANATSFSSTANGIGSIGFVFELDAASQLAAQQFITGSNRVGLSSSLTLATGGLDTFSILDGVAPPASGEVPEPGSMLLIGLGLLGLGAARRKKV